jgi:hypothetical protein
VTTSLYSLITHRGADDEIDKKATTDRIAEFHAHQRYLALTEENTTNEANGDCENVTNEPPLGANVGLESPTYVKTPMQCSTNEATDACENLTNEPNDDRETVTNEPACHRRRAGKPDLRESARAEFDERTCALHAFPRLTLNPEFN